MTNYTYNAGNQLTSDGTTSYTYDSNGNLTTYTWDRANRMISGGGTTYAYDGAGNRIRQTVSANVTRYLLDLQPGLAVVLAATTGANVDRYVHGARGIHAQRDAANNWECMVQDGLGSVRGVADNNAGVLWGTGYAAYGAPINGVGTAQTMYGFTSEPTDGNGLVHLRARYYAPSLGIFASLDPFEGMAGRPMSLNGYSWVEGNVPNEVDRTGRCAQPTEWWNPIDVNCYYSAVGLAQRLSQGNANAYDAWFNALIQKSWSELKVIEAVGTGPDTTGALNQFMTNSSILPSLLVRNPALALQALQQWGCQNNINLSFLGGFAAVGTAGTLSGGTATGAAGGVTIGGAPVVLAALGGLAVGILVSLLFAGTAAEEQNNDEVTITSEEVQKSLLAVLQHRASG